ARGVGDVSLEAREPAGDWQPLATVAPDAQGAFATVVTPSVGTQYRLAAGTLHAGLVKVAVVPLVQASLSTGGAQGTVQPARGGSPVQVQLQNGTAWATVASGTTDPTGAFVVTAELAPGTYRVRCAPG